MLAGQELDRRLVCRTFSDCTTAPRNGLVSGCYPLVPYSGRLGYRRFKWLGQEHRTAANFDDNPHSVHGVAWQRPWEVASSSATEACMVFLSAPST